MTVEIAVYDPFYDHGQAPQLCHKCGMFGSRSVRYRDEEVQGYGERGEGIIRNAEHLEWACERCGHILTTMCADHKEPSA